ncbi:MAG: polyprenyl synthetase family protein [Sulfolobales archaeon]|jgi:geranylgeranyl diphosphate synthase type I|nr:polyprenyl synthetase family protein [Sulfolobales archaeon]MCG2908922.1 polyprenyl synthetase family protein [Sulfolobales archaeon]MCQ4448190.1 polyprenyl synthetase family protein [Sulfolobales archaeon]
MSDSYADEVIQEVNEAIKSYVDCVVPKLCEASYHLFTGGGKRLRPLILVAFSDLLGGRRDRAIKAGAAVEMLHNFTLIHDDIMDNDTMRRGLPTVHVKYGVPMAILAGDLLHALAFKALNDAFRGSKYAYEAIDLFVKGIITISEGQALDMSFEERTDVTEQEYMDMIYRKTAALFMVSSGLGAYVAEAEEEVIHAMEYGKNLGIAFQIVDDILGLIGDEKELGKPLYSDIREGKKTVLVLKTLREASEPEKEVVLSALGNKNASKETLTKAAEIIKAHSLDFAYALAERYKGEALKALSSIKSVRDDRPLKLLTELAELTVKRRK